MSDPTTTDRRLVGSSDAGAQTADDGGIQHVDALIIGAGLSGVGAACHLRRRLPETRFVILEARDAMGGTWDLFRYPGIRSDSDMFTLGYDFRPWTDTKALADGPSILRYIEETARDHGVSPHIRYHRRVTALSWDSRRARWTASVRRTDTGQVERITADFVYSCTGYYRYDQGYTPEFAGTDRFQGRIVHPQHWPQDLDPAGQRFVVIGSGATAVTLVPALARSAAQVVMVQRSPSYILSLPEHDPVAEHVRRWLPASAAYRLVRWKNVLLGSALFQLSRRWPGLVKWGLRKQLERQLPDDFDIDTHFTPRYDPWDQRLCLVPNSDLFRALRSGRASMVTDTIDEFTEQGLALDSGRVLEADVIVTATGLNMLPMGGIDITVDGHQVDVSETVAYKGMMLSGVPNFAFALGYTNASWTLKVDLVSDYVCRLLEYMAAHDYDKVTPRRPAPAQPLEPLIDLTSGYVQRSIHCLPRQTTRAPWRLHQNYLRDIRQFRHGDVDDRGVEFTRAQPVRQKDGHGPRAA